jgi:hypothetical protein
MIATAIGDRASARLALRGVSHRIVGFISAARWARRRREALREENCSGAGCQAGANGVRAIRNYYFNQDCLRLNEIDGRQRHAEEKWPQKTRKDAKNRWWECCEKATLRLTRSQRRRQTKPSHEFCNCYQPALRYPTICMSAKIVAHFYRKNATVSGKPALAVGPALNDLTRPASERPDYS